MFAGGLAHFGFVTELLSMPVRLGYLAGIAVTVIVAQLPKLFGFSVDAENLIPALRDFAASLDETNTTALALGAGALALILGLRAVAPKLPGVFIAVVAATVAVAAFGLADDVPVVGSVPAGLPAVALPHVSVDGYPVASWQRVPQRTSRALGTAVSSDAPPNALPLSPACDRAVLRRRAIAMREHRIGAAGPRNYAPRVNPPMANCAEYSRAADTTIGRDRAPRPRRK